MMRMAGLKIPWWANNAYMLQALFAERVRRALAEAKSGSRYLPKERRMLDFRSYNAAPRK
jgi:hypothetical protein